MKGREIIICGKEARLVSGTIDQINDAIQDMKKRHGVDYVTMVELDNGSFAEGFRTFDKQLTEEDWISHFNRNIQNGHGLYIKSYNKRKRP